MLSIPLHYRNDLENVLIPHGLILDRTEALATEIFNDFGNEPLICLCVLKGGYKFFADLTDRIQSKNRTNGHKSLPMMIDFIRLKSYHVSGNFLSIIYLIKLTIFFIIKNTESQGEVQIIGSDDMSNIKGKVTI